MDTFAAPTNLGQRMSRSSCGGSLVVDVGCHHGHASLGYLNRSSRCSAYAFEAEADNSAQAGDLLATFADWVDYSPAISDFTGEITINVNGHNSAPLHTDMGTSATVSRPPMRLDDMFKTRRSGHRAASHGYPRRGLSACMVLKHCYPSAASS
jgi:hypothetical protein